MYPPAPLRTVGFWLSAAILLNVLASAGACAQSTLSVPARLVLTDSGFIGIEHRGGGTTLARYDWTLMRRGTLWLPGANVLDVVPGRILSTKDPSSGILLISVAGQTGLYSTHLIGGKFDSEFSLSPFNVDTLPHVTNIVGRVIVPGASGGSTEALLLAGDSALCAVNDSGRILFSASPRSLGGHVVRTLTPSSAPGSTLLVTRAVDGIHLLLLDAASGTIKSEQRLETDGDVWAGLCPEDGGEVLVVAVASPSPAVWVADVGLASAPRRFPLRGPPIGVATITTSTREVKPVVVLATLPRPSIQIAGDDQAIALDYYAESQPQEFLTSGAIRVLAAADSLALFDDRFVARGTAPSIGGVGRTLVALDSTRAIVVHTAGSRVIALQPVRSWVATNWIPLVLGAGACVIVLLVIAAWQRFRFLRTVYSNMVRVPGAQGVIVANRRGRVRRLNDAARRSLAIDTYIPRGRHILEYLRGEHLEPVLPLVRGLLANGESFTRRLDMSLEAGLRTINVQGRPMSSPNGSTAGYLLLVDDVTDTLERDRLLNWASVAHHIAHEMKTPLGTVMMTAELLHQRLSASDSIDDATRSTSRIVRQAARLREIVDDLLTIARSEAPQRTPADLALLVQGVAHDVGEHLPSNIAIEVKVSVDDCRCLVDVNQIVAAFRNLLDNAWQAIGDRAEGRISVDLNGTEDALTVAVTDNGPGMDQRTLARIFQPFYTERQGGSGIGTMIIKRVVEAHQGTVDVSSTPGLGTTFTITLPKR